MLRRSEISIPIVQESELTRGFKDVISLKAFQDKNDMSDCKIRSARALIYKYLCIDTVRPSTEINPVGLLLLGFIH